MDNTDDMRVINPDTPPEAPRKPLDAEGRARIAALAQRQQSAQSVLMQIVTFVGGQVEDGLSLLPEKTRAQLDGAAKRALRASYDAAGRSHVGVGRMVQSDRAHKALASLSGALGGLGGLPTALVELPIATTVIFRAVQRIAGEHGEDMTTPETRAECLLVFGKGGPGSDDDGIDTSFVGARLSLTGPALNRLISQIAPRFATILGQKLASQAVPVLGAAAGAGTNYAFMDYYTELAHVHFGLRALARDYDEEAVAAAYAEEWVALTAPPVRRA